MDLWNIIVTVATTVLAILTGIYVVLTKHILREMKTSREPSVYVDIEAPDNWFRFIVGNSGQKPALNVRFSVEKDIECLKSSKDKSGIASIPVIEEGISYLTPNRVLKWHAGLFEPSKNEVVNNLLQMKILYENEEGKDFERTVVIDMSMYNRVLYESYLDPSMGIAKAIEQVDSRHRFRDHSVDILSFIGTRICSICGERISSKAKKCPHCHEWLAESEENEDKTK